MGVMLSVKDLVVNYGAINAIKGISFDVNEGEIVTLIGASGAGKSTTLHAVSRLREPTGRTPERTARMPLRRIMRWCFSACRV